MKTNVLLLGGNGFLGRGLQDELTERNIPFRSIDKDDLDLHCVTCIGKLIDILKDYTHIVILAAKLGRELFESKPDENAEYNKNMFSNIVFSILGASYKYNSKFNVTYYSTSEVYGSMKSKDELITENTKPKVSPIGRGKYAYDKLRSENVLKALYNSDRGISDLKIIRPFNVSGKYQQRGVLFDMVKTLKDTGSIWFSGDTTRSLTSADYAKRKGVDIIMDVGFKTVNLTENITMTMQSLAGIVVCALKSDVGFLLGENPDKSIQYRQTSPVPEVPTVHDIRMVKNLIRELDV